MKAPKLLQLSLIVIATLSLLSCFKKSTDKEEVMIVPESDTLMNQAMEDARNSMLEFLEHFAANDTNESGFAIKVMVVDSFGTEHLWANEIDVTEEGYSGIIANVPKFVKSVSFGSEIEFTNEEISDWAYVDSAGVRQGSYTLKALLPRMSKEEADSYRKMFRWTEN